MKKMMMIACMMLFSTAMFAEKGDMFVGAGLSYGIHSDYKNFGIGLNCHNLLNTRYEQGGVSTGFIRQQGRWLMAEVSYKF